MCRRICIRTRQGRSFLRCWEMISKYLELELFVFLEAVVVAVGGVERVMVEFWILEGVLLVFVVLEEFLIQNSGRASGLKLIVLVVCDGGMFELDVHFQGSFGAIRTITKFLLASIEPLNLRCFSSPSLLYRIPQPLAPREVS